MFKALFSIVAFNIAFSPVAASSVPGVEKLLLEPPSVVLGEDGSFPSACNGLGVAPIADIEAFALANNLELNSLRSASFASKSRNLSSYLALVPSFSVSAGYTRYPESYSSLAQSTQQFDEFDNRVDVFQQSYDFTSSDYSSFTASFTWNLLIPTVYTGIRQSSSLFEASVHDVDFLESSIVRQVRSASLDAISSLQSVRSNHQSYTTSQEILKGVQAQFDLGFLSQVELLRQKSQVAQFRLQLLNSLSRFDSSVLSLNRLINYNSSQCKIFSIDTIDVLVSLLPVVSAPEDELILLALANRSDLKMMSSQLNAQRARLDGVYAAYLPQTIISAGYNFSNTDSLRYYSNDFSSDVNTGSFANDFTVSLSTSLTFDGGQGIASANAIRKDIESLEFQIEDKRSSISTNITSTKSDLDYLIQQSSILNDKLDYSGKSLKAITTRFDLGYSLLSDLLDAQRVFSNTQLEFIQNSARKANAIALLLFEISSNQ